MQVSLLSMCSGAVSTIIAMEKHPEEFEHVKSMIALQPLSAKPGVDAGMQNGLELFDEAFRQLTGCRVSDFAMPASAKSIRVPTFLVQVRDDVMTKP